MPKITFIGGGSVLWIPDLLSDIALTPTLSGAQIVLQDIDPGALQRILPVARRIVKQTGADLQITATLDRAEALRGADFVVLCVSIGGLEAMRSDLEIPLKYGIYQSVGDTVGPGG
jgi:alpha-galactosidase